MLESIAPLLPDEQPVHLLGIADPESAHVCVPAGIDTFDSCYPTRLGRHGTAFCGLERLNMRRSIFKSQFSTPIQEVGSSTPCAVDAPNRVAILFPQPSSMLSVAVFSPQPLSLLSVAVLILEVSPYPSSVPSTEGRSWGHSVGNCTLTIECRHAGVPMLHVQEPQQGVHPALGLST